MQKSLLQTNFFRPQFYNINNFEYSETFISILYFFRLYIIMGNFYLIFYGNTIQ